MNENEHGLVHIQLCRDEAVRLRDFMEAYGDESDEEIIAAIKIGIAATDLGER